MPFTWTGVPSVAPIKIAAVHPNYLHTCEIALPTPGTVQHWRKVGTRAAQAIAKVSIATAARVDAGCVAELRLAFGGVAHYQLRLHGVESTVAGMPPDAALAERVRAAVRESLDPVTDVRSTADYPRDVAANLAGHGAKAMRPRFWL